MPVELTDASIRVQQAGTPITIRFVGNGDTYTVPSGKRLLIQYINWNNFGCQIAVWNAGAVDFGGNPAHRFSFEDASGIGEPVTIHAGGGQIVRMTPGGQVELS